MSILEQQLVQLIRISVSGTPEPISSKLDWTEMMHYSSSQGVLGVAFGAIEHLSAEDRPHIDFIMDWMRQITYLESINKIHKDIIAELSSFLQKHDIPMLLLKGYESQILVQLEISISTLLVNGRKLIGLYVRNSE